MADGDGWRRGAKGIDGNKGSDFLTQKAPFEAGAQTHDISGKYGSEFKGACDPWGEPTWKPGPVSLGGKFHSTNGPPKGDFGTSPKITAASPSGKYAKKGGKGQRSGA